EAGATETGATETGATETGATAVPPPAPAAAQAPPNPFEGEAGRRVKRRAPPLDAPNPLPSELALMRRARLGDSGMLEVTTPEGVRALTVDPVLQRQLTHVMASYRTPHAAAVVLDPSTGKVLAMAQHAHEAPEDHGLPVRAAYPAASIFKIITASALVRHGLGPTTQECYDGGLRRISKRDLLSPGSRCASLADAMGQSTNVIFGKLTHQHLTAAALREEAERFGFNRSIPFAIPVEPSEARIPETAFALAETGAGFGDVYLSPLHGALIASTIANGGIWKDPILFESLPPLPGAVAETDAPAQDALPVAGAAAALASSGTSAAETVAGKVAETTGEIRVAPTADTDRLPPTAGASSTRTGGGEAPTAPLSVSESVAASAAAGGEVVRIMDAEHAAALAEMLEATVTRGTARRVFAERGYRVEGAVGKTGTLADNRPFRDYSWFIGYAPKDNPRVAVAVVVVNDPIWHIRATWLGREAMRLALARLEGEVAHVVSAAPMKVPVLTPEPLP
ncbi:MAG TPA: penicillin-binding transpeptidase domain-containing protein, partial [Myxococcaceae bacterium]|nr:penicillin-binding transpeptidase domain-containing protein [Myxococcaceae bacterium]